MREHYFSETLFLALKVLYTIFFVRRSKHFFCYFIFNMYFNVVDVFLLFCYYCSVNLFYFQKGKFREKKTSRSLSVLKEIIIKIKSVINLWIRILTLEFVLSEWKSATSNWCRRMKMLKVGYIWDNSLFRIKLLTVCQSSYNSPKRYGNYIQNSIIRSSRREKDDSYNPKCEKVVLLFLSSFFF